MKLIGLTGLPGSGKSRVGTILTSWGIPGIDSDIVAHDCLKNYHPASQDVIKLLGHSILDSQGQLDRSKIAKLVLSNSQLNMQLKQILHPWIFQALESQRTKWQQDGYQASFMEIPFLFEAGLSTWVDDAWEVQCPISERELRVAKRGWSRDDLLQREASFWPETKRASLASWVLLNSGTPEDLAPRVQERLHFLKISIFNPDT